MGENEVNMDEMLEHFNLDELLETKFKIDDMITALDIAIEECDEALNA